jgi:hypothetical protein
VACFQKENGLTPTGKTDAPTLALMAKHFQAINGMKQTGVLDQPTLDKLAAQSGTKPMVAPPPPPVTGATVQTTPKKDEIDAGAGTGQARRAMTDEETAAKLTAALKDKPVAPDIAQARKDRADLAGLSGQLSDVRRQQTDFSISTQGAMTNPDLDAREADLQKQIAAINQRLAKSAAGKDFAELDRQNAALKSAQPSWWGRIFGEDQPAISLRADAKLNVDLLKAKLGES